MSLPNVRFHSAVKWATVMSWGHEGLSSLTTFILALILGPNDFGVVVLALAFVGLLDLFAQQGFHGSIVQRAECSDVDLDSVFWITLTLGAVLTVAGLLASGPIARFYSLPELAPLMQVSAAAIMLRSLTVVQEAKLTREMDFRSLAVRTNVSVISGATLGIAVALAGGGAWAIVVQYLTRDAVGLLILWRAARWMPRPRFHRAHAWEMTIFSAKYFPSTLFDYMGSQAEPMMMGSFFGPVAVGIYRLAIRIVDLVVMMVTRALWYVSFPYFSQAKGDVALLRHRVKECMRFASIFALPLLALLALESPALAGVLGADWLAAAPVIRVLCLYGAIHSMTLFAGPLLFGSGRPQVQSMMVGIQCAALCGAAFGAGALLRDQAIGAQTVGIAWARVAVYATVFLPLAGYVIIRVAKTSLIELVRVLIPGAIATLVLVVVQLVLTPVTGTGVAGLVIRACVAGLAALAAVALMNQDTVKGLLHRISGSRELA